MSFYATIEGTLTYDSDADFDAAMKVLGGQNGWIDSYGNFLDELDEIIAHEACNAKTRTIRIPLNLHRNLDRYLIALCKNSVGKLLCTSTDGVLEGWIVEDGHVETWDLSVWARKRLMSPPPESDGVRYVEWVNSVESAFHRWARNHYNIKTWTTADDD